MPRSTKPALLLMAGVLLLAAGVFIWRQGGVSNQTAQPTADPYASLDLKDPKPSFLLLQYVAAHGGDQYTRQFSIDWLSEQARLRQPLKPDQENWLYSMIEAGGHKNWEIGYKLWLFNDAFNCLHMANDQNRLTHLLQDLALHHEDKTMRLYALQHLEIQRSRGHLEGDLANQVHASLINLARDDQSEVAGTALVNLLSWDGPEIPPFTELVDLALDIAADTLRSDDIRVTALHAVGQHSLTLARALAPDTTQSVHVRKAAIAWMGKYGNETDNETLKQLAQENFRIAQAAKPALAAIKSRKNGEPARTLIKL